MKLKHRKEIKKRFFEYRKNNGNVVINSWNHWRIGMILYWSARLIYNVRDYTEKLRYREELSTRFYKAGAIYYDINICFPGCLNSLKFTKTPFLGLERSYYYDTNNLYL